mgnify:CR=1 FL=1
MKLHPGKLVNVWLETREILNFWGGSLCVSVAENYSAVPDQKSPILTVTERVTGIF